MLILLELSAFIELCTQEKLKFGPEFAFDWFRSALGERARHKAYRLALAMGEVVHRAGWFFFQALIGLSIHTSHGRGGEENRKDQVAGLKRGFAHQRAHLLTAPQPAHPYLRKAHGLHCRPRGKGVL